MGARELLLHADVQGGPASTEVLEGGRPQQGAGQACSHIPGHQGFITRMKTKLCLSFLSFCLSFLLSLSLLQSLPFFLLHKISAKWVTKPVVMNAEGRTGGEGESERWPGRGTNQVRDTEGREGRGGCEDMEMETGKEGHRRRGSQSKREIRGPSGQNPERRVGDGVC